jgi:hypothetical protein
LHSRKIGQSTLKFSNGRAHSGDNDYIFHNGRPHFLDAKTTEHNTMTTMEPPQPTRVRTYEQGGLLAPW